MYYLITPKKKSACLATVPAAIQTFVSDNECYLQIYDDSPIFGIAYRLPSGDITQLGGTIEPLFRFTKKKYYLRHITWQVTEEFPEYVNIERIFEKILRRLFRAIGEFSLYIIPLDRSYVVKDEETADELALTLATSYPEIFKENEKLIKKIEKNNDVDSVIEEINSYNVPYSIILAKLYAWSHLEANTLNGRIMDALVENVFTRLEPKKWRKVRSLILYKFMQGARWLRSGFLRHISAPVLVRTYLGLIDKCSLNNETTQFLVNDLILTGIAKAQDTTYREIKERLIARVKKLSGVQIFAPEILSFYELEKTGNQELALNTYISANNKHTPANLYRKELQKSFPVITFVNDFFQSTLKNIFKFAPFTTKLKNWRLTFAFSSKNPTAKLSNDTTFVPPIIAAIFSILVTGISCFSYLQNIQENNAFIAYYQADTFTIITKMFGLGALLLIPTAVTLWVIYKALLNIRTMQNGLKKILVAVGVSIFATPFIITFVGLLMIVFANVSISEKTIAGATNTHFVKGLDWYAFDEIDQVTYQIKYCIRTDTSCELPTIELQGLKKNGTSFSFKTDYIFESNNSERQKETCKTLETFNKEMKARNVKIRSASSLDFGVALSMHCKTQTLESN